MQGFIDPDSLTKPEAEGLIKENHKRADNVIPADLNSAGFVDPDRSPAEGQSFLESAIDFGKTVGANFIEGVRKTGEGVAQLGVEGAEAIGILPEDLSPEGYTEYVEQQRAEREAQLQEDYPDFPISGKVAQIAGQMAPLATMPFAKAATAARTAGLGALQGGAIGGAQFVPKGDSRARQALLGATITAGLPITGQLMKKGYSVLRGSIKPIGKDVARMIPDEALQTAKEAKALGIHLTPGEATGSQGLKAVEAGLNIPKKAQLAIARTADENIKAVRKTADNLLDQFTPEGSVTARKMADEAYTALRQQNIAPEVMDDLLSDPQVSKVAASVLRSVPGAKRNSFEFLDSVNSFLRDKVNTLSKTKPALAKIYQQSRNNMLNKAEKAIPGYKDARALAQRSILHDKYTAKLDKIARNSGEDVASSPAKIYNSLFAKPADEAQFLDDIATAGGDINKARKAIKVLNRAKDNVLDKIAGKAIRNEVALFPTEMASQALSKSFGKAYLKLITDPNWMDKIAKIKLNDSGLSNKVADIYIQAWRAISPADTAARAITVSQGN